MYQLNFVFKFFVTVELNEFLQTLKIFFQRISNYYGEIENDVKLYNTKSDKYLHNGIVVNVKGTSHNVI